MAGGAGGWCVSCVFWRFIHSQVYDDEGMVYMKFMEMGKKRIVNFTLCESTGIGFEQRTLRL